LLSSIHPYFKTSLLPNGLKSFGSASPPVVSKPYLLVSITLGENILLNPAPNLILSYPKNYYKMSKADIKKGK